MTESQGQLRRSGEGGQQLGQNIMTSVLFLLRLVKYQEILLVIHSMSGCTEWALFLGQWVIDLGIIGVNVTTLHDMKISWRRYKKKKKKKPKTANPLNCITWFIWSVVSLQHNLWVYNSESNTYRAVTLSDKSSICKLQVRSNRLSRSCCHWLQTCRVLQACSPCAQDVSDLS